MSTFADRLAAALDKLGNPACVGLDPVIERIPASLQTADQSEEARAATIEKFCAAVIDMAAGVVPVVKFQSACFERYGPSGLNVLRRLLKQAKSVGLITILDAKRGDIGVTVEHYRTSIFGSGPDPEVDAVTLNGYLGMETIEPFLRPDGRTGVFVLVRTSNPGSDDFQQATLADGRSVAELMASHVAEIGRQHLGRNGMSQVGAVVGATKASIGQRLRLAMPYQFFLIPGYGAQGGTIEDVRIMLRHGGGGGVIVTASRSVLFPSAETAFGGWAGAIANAIRALAVETSELHSNTR